MVSEATAGAGSVGVPAAAWSFQPFRDHVGARARGCYTCRYFLGRIAGEHLVCEQRGVHIVARPRDGCAYWEREPGSDDE